MHFIITDGGGAGGDDLLSGKFLRIKVCYLESFSVLCLCLNVLRNLHQVSRREGVNTETGQEGDKIGVIIQPARKARGRAAGARAAGCLRI